MTLTQNSALSERTDLWKVQNTENDTALDIVFSRHSQCSERIRAAPLAPDTASVHSALIDDDDDVNNNASLDLTPRY